MANLFFCLLKHVFAIINSIVSNPSVFALLSAPWTPDHNTHLLWYRHDQIRSLQQRSNARPVCFLSLWASDFGNSYILCTSILQLYYYLRLLGVMTGSLWTWYVLFTDYSVVYLICIDTILANKRWWWWWWWNTWCIRSLSSHQQPWQSKEFIPWHVLIHHSSTCSYASSFLCTTNTHQFFAYGTILLLLQTCLS